MINLPSQVWHYLCIDNNPNNLKEDYYHVPKEGTKEKLVVFIVVVRISHVNYYACPYPKQNCTCHTLHQSEKEIMYVDG